MALVRSFYSILICLLIASCQSTAKTKQVDLTYKLIEDQEGVGYLISSDALDNDIRIMGRECLTKESRFHFNFVKKDSKRKLEESERLRFTPWSFFFNDIQGYSHYLKFYNASEFNQKIKKVQVAKDLGDYMFGGLRIPDYSPKINISSNKLVSLVELCKDKYAKNQLEIKERQLAAKEKNNKNRLAVQKLINKVKKSTGLKPMFDGKNELSFNQLVYRFLNGDFNQHKNKFVWLTDGDFKVSQALTGRVILTSRYDHNVPPITIITKKQAIEGQFWSAVSRAPMKFIGLNNYITVLGSRKQTIIFQQL